MLIILPIETTARELDYKIQIGQLLAARTGINVIITATTYAKKIAFDLDSDCVFIGKHIFRDRSSGRHSNTATQRVLDSHCHIIHLDEEGGLNLRGDYSSSDITAFTNRQPELPNQEDVISRISLAHWGSYQNTLGLQINPNYRHFTTGVPAFDACKVLGNRVPHQDLQAPSKPYLIGITANACGFSLGNKHWQSLPEMMLEQYRLNSADFIESIRSEIGMLSIAESLVKAYPKQTILYRPHPGSGRRELMQILKQLCKNYPNFQISRPSQESSIDYLMRIDLNIHSNCTTALQSFFLGKQSLHVKGFDYGFKRQLLNESSCDPSKVEQFIAEFSKESPDHSQQWLTELGKQLIANDNPRKLTAYESIIQMVSDVLPSNALASVGQLRRAKSILNKHILTHRLKFAGKSLARATLPFSMSNSQKSQTNTLYDSEKIRNKVRVNQRALARIYPEVQHCTIEYLANGLLVTPGC